MKDSGQLLSLLGFCGCGGGLVGDGGTYLVGGGSLCGDLGVFPIVMDLKEVMLTSPTELAHCAPPPSPPQ